VFILPISKPVVPNLRSMDPQGSTEDFLGGPWPLYA